MLRKTLMWLPVLLLFAAPLAAQTAGPTPEGTKITNTATVSYTDANGNTYQDETASSEVTVGFKAGVTVDGDVSVTTASGVQDTATFTVTNAGNGDDRFTFDLTGTTAGITNISYLYDGDEYATLELLYAAIWPTGADSTAAGTSIVIGVIYTVAENLAGQDQAITFTATSVRDTDMADDYTTDILVPNADVSVTASPTTRDVIGTGLVVESYTVTFTVKNEGDATSTFTLAPVAGGAVTIVDDDLPSSMEVELAAGAEVTYTFTYTVTGGDPSGTLKLTATDKYNSFVADDDTHTATVLTRLIEVTKLVYRADGTTLVGENDEVIPGETLVYKITVKNLTAFDAKDIEVGDPLPSALTYVSHDDTGFDSSAFDSDTNTVTALLATLLAAGEVVLVITVTVT
jgi:uncharacterized repeat protein (TIGR01451 family)